MTRNLEGAAKHLTTFDRAGPGWGASAASTSTGMLLEVNVRLGSARSAVERLATDPGSCSNWRRQRRGFVEAVTAVPGPYYPTVSTPAAAPSRRRMNRMASGFESTAGSAGQARAPRRRSCRPAKTSAPLPQEARCRQHASEHGHWLLGGIAGPFTPRAARSSATSVRRELARAASPVRRDPGMYGILSTASGDQ